MIQLVLKWSYIFISYFSDFFKRFSSQLNVDRPTHIWLLIGTSFASLTRDNHRQVWLPPIQHLFFAFADACLDWNLLHQQSLEACTSRPTPLATTQFVEHRKQCFSVSCKIQQNMTVFTIFQVFINRTILFLFDSKYKGSKNASRVKIPVCDLRTVVKSANR